MLKLRMYKAGNGDCISVQTEDNFILIDGGTAQSFIDWKEYIVDVVEKIDMLFITHIDNDHVNGIVKLLMDENCPPIGEIYFNGVEQLFEKENKSNIDSSSTDLKLKAFSSELTRIDSNVKIGYSEGTSLSFLINEKGINCNPLVFGKAIARENIDNFSCGNINFKLIGPKLKDLEELRDTWLRSLRKKNIKPKIINKFYFEAFELYVKQLEDSITSNVLIGSKDIKKIEVLAKLPFVPDQSLSNKSSLSFILEYNGRKILFLGDCHIETVEEWFKIEGIEKLTLDAVKISHHGSKNNTSLSFLNKIDCQNYLISTNGKLHDHPDLETLARIVVANKDKKTSIYMNYEINSIPSWFLSEVETDYPNVKILMNSDGFDL